MTAQFIPVDAFDLVVFGGTGDLAMRKLLPGLYRRCCDGQLTDDSRIIGIARSDLDDETYRSKVLEALHRYVADDVEPMLLERFLQRLHFVRLDAMQDDDWSPLHARLNGHDDRVRVFYLATGPSLFGPVAQKIARNELLTGNSRVVIEKPVGHDLASAEAINREIGEVLREDQIYRIDHYLGKETVQNLLSLRFANILFEPLWNSQAIEHVQITVAEDIGVGDRGGYYDRSGALRDMVQNHILQLLCLVAMEPPAALDASAVRDEKLKVLRSLRPITEFNINTHTVRGQYTAGAVHGEPVKGYLDELGTGGRSDTETYCVVKAEIDNWRWAGVPFYLRTGKRLAVHQSDIVIQFRAVPHSIFNEATSQIVPNRLLLRLQPDEGVKLYMMTKEPGPGGLRLKNVPLNLSYADTFVVRYPDAYERLLMDVVRGNPTLFMRKDEVSAAWTWIDPILKAWDALGTAPKPYPAGSWGPAAATALMARDNRSWLEEVV